MENRGWFENNTALSGGRQPSRRSTHESHIKAREAGNEIGRAEDFNRFVAGLGIEFVYSIQPAYSPRRDLIKMPPRESFDSIQHWGGTLSHELGHWSGAAGRMGREAIINPSGFGSDPYAEEEAVAEWFALLACNQFGLIREGDGGIDNHAAYIQSWTARFAADPDLLARTFREAEKAFAWALEKSGVQTKAEAEEMEAEGVAA